MVHAMRIGMYIRTISRKNKDGSAVTYVQLAHNTWDTQSRCAKAQVLHTFGRTDELDTAALKRLAKSISRFLTPEDAIRVNASMGGAVAPLNILRSVPLGGAYLLRALWEQLRIPHALSQCMKDRSFTSPVIQFLLAGTKASFNIPETLTVS